MDDQAAVREANAAFYRAFSGGELREMESVWARRAPVLCIHPGWDVLVGREAVLASWREIFAGGGVPAIRCSRVAVQLYGDTACVTCREQVPGAQLVATNLFVREDGAWRMVHHHAGPSPRVEDEPPLH